MTYFAVQTVLLMTWFYKEWGTKIAKTWNNIIPPPNGKLVENNFIIPQFY